MSIIDIKHFQSYAGAKSLKCYNNIRILQGEYNKIQNPIKLLAGFH